MRLENQRKIPITRRRRKKRKSARKKTSVAAVAAVATITTITKTAGMKPKKTAMENKQQDTSKGK